MTDDAITPGELDYTDLPSLDRTIHELAEEKGFLCLGHALTSLARRLSPAAIHTASRRG